MSGTAPQLVVNEFAPTEAMFTKTADGKETPQFVLFTSDWLNLQTHVTQSLQLPISQGEFITKYGSLGSDADSERLDQKTVTDAIGAMKRLHDEALVFGDPRVIKNRLATDGAYLNGAEPPSEIYGHIIWLASQIQQTATMFDLSYAGLLQDLDPSKTPAQRMAALKEILTGNGGLVSEADAMKRKTERLVQILAAFDGRLNEANEAFKRFSGGDLIARVDRRIGALSATIDTSQKAADAAYNRWIGYTAGAVTAAVVGAIITIAIVVASAGTLTLAAGAAALVTVGATSALAYAAIASRKLYNEMTDEVNKSTEDKRKKTMLAADLRGLNTRIDVVQPALGNFRSKLAGTIGVWNDASMKLAFIANNITVDQLAAMSARNQANKILTGQDRWRAVADATEQYTQKSLVEYEMHQWGTRLRDAA
jgi:hypothetical protein